MGIIIAVSIIFQFLAAGLAIRLIRVTRHYRAAGSIFALALILMGIRQIIVFYQFLYGQTDRYVQTHDEWIALAISVLMAVGVLLGGKLIQGVKRSEEEYHRIKKTLDHILDPIFIINPETLKFTYVNRGAVSHFGFGVQELESMTLPDLYPDLGRNEFRKDFLNPLKVVPFHFSTFETQFRHKNGTLIPVEVTLQYISPLEEEGRYVAVVRDLVERKKIEEEKDRLSQQLIQAEKLSSVGTFVSGIAHELNNPLTGILGFSEDLLETDLSDKEALKQGLSIIHREADRSAQIVKNLLLFTRRYKPEHEKFWINEATQSVVSLLVYQLTADNIRIRTSYQANLPAMYGNYNQIQQVLLNVLSNAHHAIKKGKTGKGNIWIRTREVDRHVLIEIENDGPPIPKDSLNRIFDPFFTTKEIGEGTGLGLSVCHGIITDHDGTIWADNLPDEKGVRFTIEFPGLGMEGPRIESPMEDKKEYDGAGKLVLVVDDEELVVTLLARILEKHWFQVVTARSGEQALGIIKTEPVDLVITDVKMPDMDGIGLYEKITAQTKRLSDRFIFATGDIGHDLEEFCQRTGVLCIRKPFNWSQVLETIRTVLENE